MSASIETFEAYGTTFSAGTRHRNLIGEYVVRGVLQEERRVVIDVAYVDGPRAGQSAMLDARGQAKSFFREGLRADREAHLRRINLKDADESFTLGFLARRGFVCVRIKQSARGWFEPAYRRLTGVEAWAPGVPGHYYDISPDDVEGSGNYFHVGFPTPPDHVKGLLTFGREDTVHWDAFGGTSKYNNMNYVLNLLSVGFRLGKAHEADVARGQSGDQAAFDEGYFLEFDQRVSA